MSAGEPSRGATSRSPRGSEAQRVRRDPASDGRGGRPALHALPALRRFQHGRWGYILAWLIGVPVPILVVIYLLRGCT